MILKLINIRIRSCLRKVVVEILAEFMASPNIAADVEVADKTELYVKADGKLYSNSMYDMSYIATSYLITSEHVEPKSRCHATPDTQDSIQPVTRRSQLFHWIQIGKSN